MNGNRIPDPSSASQTEVKILLKDVNDEHPKFERKEYEIEIPENTKNGTKIESLNIFVEDKDLVSTFFKFRISNSLSQFYIGFREITVYLHCL